MRVEINIPDDKKFNDKLQALVKADKRSRKNWIENLVITTVNQLPTEPQSKKHTVS